MPGASGEPHSPESSSFALTASEFPHPSRSPSQPLCAPLSADLPRGGGIFPLRIARTIPLGQRQGSSDWSLMPYPANARLRRFPVQRVSLPVYLRIPATTRTWFRTFKAETRVRIPLGVPSELDSFERTVITTIS